MCGLLAIKSAPEPYIGEDGFQHCSVCGGALEAIVKAPPFKGGNSIRQRIECSCNIKEREERKRMEENRRLNSGIQSLIDKNLTEKSWYNCRFEDVFTMDEIINDTAVKTAYEYVENFSEHKERGEGLLIMGTVGTGKTLLMSCIVRKLTDTGYSAFIINCGTIAKAFSDYKTRDIIEMKRLCHADFLVIDDLGSETLYEQQKSALFEFVDKRYNASIDLNTKFRTALGVTTNKTPDEMLNCTNINDRRIYDRIRETCPIRIIKTGESKRGKKKTEENLQILSGK